MKILLLSALLFFVLLSNALAQEQPKVTLGVILFPPETRIDPQTGKCIGKNIDRTRNILAVYKIRLEVVCISAIRIYRLIEDAEIDFTINIKSTKALKPHVTFIKKPVGRIILNLYQHKNEDKISSIAAVRGFDYVGQRQHFLAQGTEFIDLPNSISAIQVFIKKRSDALLSYQDPFNYYMQKNNILIGQQVIVKPILKINTFYAVANSSNKFSLLTNALNDFSRQHKHDYLFVGEPN